MHAGCLLNETIRGNGKHRSQERYHTCTSSKENLHWQLSGRCSWCNRMHASRHRRTFELQQVVFGEVESMCMPIVCLTSAVVVSSTAAAPCTHSECRPNCWQLTTCTGFSSIVYHCSKQSPAGTKPLHRGSNIQHCCCCPCPLGVAVAG
jgi:hypothetical protein